MVHLCILFHIHIVSGGAKPRQAKLGASEWWIARADHRGGHREQGHPQAGARRGRGQEVVNSGEYTADTADTAGATAAAPRIIAST